MIVLLLMIVSEDTTYIALTVGKYPVDSVPSKYTVTLSIKLLSERTTIAAGAGATVL